MVAGAVIASSSPSAVSWLYFANRLIELPLGIVGVAMGTVLVPELTRAVRGGRSRRHRACGIARARTRGRAGAAGDAGIDRAQRADRAAAVPARRIHRADTAATAPRADVAGAGLPAHVLVKALSPAFFAREDTLTPLLATLKGVVLAIAAAVVLGHWFGADGIAAAIALGAWSSALSLIRRGAATFGFSIDADAQAAAAAHRAWRRWRWAGCCGWRRGCCLRSPRARTASCRPRCC